MQDTGLQVTLFGENVFQKWLSGVQSPEALHWLPLKAASGLQIPYISYTILNFEVGGITTPGKGVIIVKDECLNAEQGILVKECDFKLLERIVQGISPWDGYIW